MTDGTGGDPSWWRGRIRDQVPDYPGQTVLTGEIRNLDLAAIPLGSGMLRTLSFQRAQVHGLEIRLDECSLDSLWSSFDDCTFLQRSRRLHREG